MSFLAKDITGLKCGNLTAISFSHKIGGYHYWNFQCDCGKICQKSKTEFSGGRVSSCGRNCLIKSCNIIGHTIGDLLILKEEGNLLISGKMRRAVKVKCQCGKELIVSAERLKASKRPSCGACWESTEDLTGQKFGWVSVIRQVSTSQNHKNRTYECQCECGKTQILAQWHLLANRKSCGCRKTSKRERSLRFKGYGEIGLRNWNAIKKNAVDRNLEFCITIEYIWDLFIQQNRTCTISGVPLRFASSAKARDGNASLDRIDSSKGYIVGNVQWVDKTINELKWDYSLDELVKLCKLVIEYQEKLNHKI